jgi:hypothetical protein
VEESLVLHADGCHNAFPRDYEETRDRHDEEREICVLDGGIVILDWVVPWTHHNNRGLLVVCWENHYARAENTWVAL